MKTTPILIALCTAAVLPFSHAAWLNIDSERHHLRSGTGAEWESFAASAPRGNRLDLSFSSEPNLSDRTLFLWQDDVKLDWAVELNGRRLGNLFTMEAPLHHTLRIPAGTLREGSNVLSILPPRDNDDIRVGAFRIADTSPRDVLRESLLKVDVRDADSGQLLPCRITITDPAGNFAALWCPTNQPVASRPGVVYTGNGQAAIHLLAGSYNIAVTRGFEFGLSTTNIALPAQGSRAVALTLRREVATPGLVSSDPHIHTATYSKHGDATVQERAITLAGEGIELPVLTDHDVLTDIRGPAESTGTAAHFTPVIGDEVTTRAGHFNIFPVRADAIIPDNKQTNWPALLARFRTTPDVRVIVLNHPRNVHNGFQPFAAANFDRLTGEAKWPLNFSFDAMELVNSSAQQTDYMTVFNDWFALLNAGHRITAVGSSDGHDVSRYIVGQGRTYIHCANDNPAAINVEQACLNLAAGRAYVSMGLLPIITVEDNYYVGDQVPAENLILKVRVEVRAPSWIQADTIRLYANGVPIREHRITQRPSPGVAGLVRWEIPTPSQDVWLVAIATGPGQLGPHWEIPKPYQPASSNWTARVIGATNPVWVDADLDGKFTSPRGYAERAVTSVRSFRQLVTRLNRHDWATSVQAAALLRRERGVPPQADLDRALRSATPEVRSGLRAVFGSSNP